MLHYSNAETQRFIRKSIRAQQVLSEFVQLQKDNAKFVSLGENCSSAWYLKQIGLKNASFPFDWIFSSPGIVIDCINTKFNIFLDELHIIPKRNGTSAGHAIYHSNLFNHKNPLKSDDDYSYFKRCVERFLDDLSSSTPTIYLITLINESAKRPGWAKGFTHKYPMPENQNCSSINDLQKTLLSKKKNIKFIIVDHYTNTDRDIQIERTDENTVFIRFSAGGDSTGVSYKNKLDDFCYKQMMCGLL